jgi:hypothetical protein
MLMGYLDGELSAGESREIEKHLNECTECSEELGQFRKLKEITDDISLNEPEDRVFEQYWSCVYNRIERRLGWILLSVSGTILVIYLGFMAIEAIVEDHTISIVLKGGLLMFYASLVILLFSVLRERLHFRKKDRYKDVRR